MGEPISSIEKAKMCALARSFRSAKLGEPFLGYVSTVLLGTSGPWCTRLSEWPPSKSTADPQTRKPVTKPNPAGQGQGDLMGALDRGTSISMGWI